MTRRLVPALVALGLLLSGCAGLSTDSEVMPGLPVGVEQGENVRIVPAEPVPGATPVDIVRGFIRAGAASDGAYDAARSFLSLRTPPDWRPDTGVTVFESGRGLSISETSPDTVRVSAPVQAAIDESGRYAETPGRTATADFTVEESSGEWRISSVPEDFGLWLGSFEADVLFRPYAINYVSTSGRLLVPDIRWFPSGKGLVTRLARAQLDGVPDYLQGAARSAVPAGARLEVDAVPVRAGVATVDLGEASFGSDTGTRQDLWAQFYSTLSQVPGVSRIALRQGGAELALPGVDGDVGSLGDIGFPVPSPQSPVQPLVRLGTALRVVDPDLLGEDVRSGTTEQRDDLPVVGTGWGPLALSADGSEVAGVGGSRADVTRWRGPNQLSVPPVGADLTPPTYDAQGVLWVGGADDEGLGRLWVINAAADADDGSSALPQTVDAPWLVERRIVSVRLSADGTRVAVISTDDEGRARVDVAGVIRGAGGVPEALSDTPRQTAFGLVTAQDAVWVGPTSLAVLGRTASGGSTTPYVVEVGGTSTALPAVQDAQSVTTFSGERGLVVTTGEGRVYFRAGSSWVPIGDASAVLVAGT